MGRHTLVAKGEPMPLTIEAYRLMLDMDNEIIIEQKEEISKLKIKVNKLQQKLDKALKKA